MTTTTTELNTTPLRDALHAAIDALAMRLATDRPDTVEEDAIISRMESDISAARDALRDSDELREYDAQEDSGASTTIMACSLEEALEEARDWAADGDYDDVTETLWITVRVTGEDGSQDSTTATIDPEEPECTEDDHDWREGQARANGGGVISTDTCETCGLRRTTDGWAQDDCGRQGLTSVSYEVRS